MKLFNLFASCIAIVIIFSSIYAFAFSGSGSHASGEGVSVVSGWEVSNVSYQLSDNPSLVSSVSFDLDGAAGNVSVKTSSSTSQFAKCSNLYKYHW